MCVCVCACVCGRFLYADVFANSNIRDSKAPYWCTHHSNCTMLYDVITTFDQRHVTTINAGFEIVPGGWKGSLTSGWTVDALPLDCTVASDATTTSVLASFEAHSTMTTVMAATVVEAAPLVKADMASCSSGQCTVGSVAADAMRWVTGARVALFAATDIEQDVENNVKLSDDPLATTNNITREVLVSETMMMSLPPMTLPLFPHVSLIFFFLLFLLYFLLAGYSSAMYTDLCSAIDYVAASLQATLHPLLTPITTNTDHC